jgi:hypothetical protein
MRPFNYDRRPYHVPFVSAQPLSLPPEPDALMLQRCLLSLRQRPPRSAPPSNAVANSRPPSSCAGCSLAFRTTSRRGTVPGPSLAGSLWRSLSGSHGRSDRRRAVALADRTDDPPGQSPALASGDRRTANRFAAHRPVTQYAPGISEFIARGGHRSCTRVRCAPA